MRLCVRWTMGTQLPPEKGTPTPPNFWPMSIVTLLSTEVDLGAGHIVLDGRGRSSPRKGHSSPHPSFRPMSIVGTVAHLSYCSALVERLLARFSGEFVMILPHFKYVSTLPCKIFVKFSTFLSTMANGPFLRYPVQNENITSGHQWMH